MSYGRWKLLAKTSDPGGAIRSFQKSAVYFSG